MIEVFLHAGFHKSGTTSVQNSLLRHGEGSLFYPQPERLGPGHCDIAQRSTRSTNKSFDPNLLFQLASEYSRILPNEVSHKLVFSSECFGRGDDFSAFETLARNFPTTLILTRRVVQEAMPSMQQERIKHGGRNAYLSEEAEQEALQDPQFNPEAIGRILRSAPFAKRFVISTSSAFPTFLFESFNKILKTHLEFRIDNRRLPKHIINRIQELNMLGELSTVEERINTAREFKDSRFGLSSYSETPGHIIRWAEIERAVQASLSTWQRTSFITHLTKRRRLKNIYWWPFRS